MSATNLADLYEAPLIEWDRIETRLGQGVSQAPETGGPNRHTSWLATVNSDGSPHVTGIGALWVEGAFFSGSRPAPGRARGRTWPAIRAVR